MRVRLHGGPRLVAWGAREGDTQVGSPEDLRSARLARAVAVMAPVFVAASRALTDANASMAKVAAEFDRLSGTTAQISRDLRDEHR